MRATCTARVPSYTKLPEAVVDRILTDEKELMSEASLADRDGLVDFWNPQPGAQISNVE